MRPDLVERQKGIASGAVREGQCLGFGVFPITDGRGISTLPNIGGVKMWMRWLIVDHSGELGEPSGPWDLGVTLRIQGQATNVVLNPHPIDSTPRFQLRGVKPTPRDTFGLTLDCPNRDLVHIGQDLVELEITGGPPDGVFAAALIADVLYPDRAVRKALSTHPQPRIKVAPLLLYSALDRKRTNVGLSWREVAKALHIAPSTFTRLQTDAPPSADVLVSLLAWLDWPDLRQFTTEPPR